MMFIDTSIQHPFLFYSADFALCTSNKISRVQLLAHCYYQSLREYGRMIRLGQMNSFVFILTLLRKLHKRIFPSKILKKHYVQNVLIVLAPHTNRLAQTVCVRQLKN